MMQEILETPSQIQFANKITVAAKGIISITYNNVEFQLLTPHIQKY